MTCTICSQPFSGQPSTGHLCLICAIPLVACDGCVAQVKRTAKTELAAKAALTIAIVTRHRCGGEASRIDKLIEDLKETEQRSKQDQVIDAATEQRRVGGGHG